MSDESATSAAADRSGATADSGHVATDPNGVGDDSGVGDEASTTTRWRLTRSDYLALGIVGVVLLAPVWGLMHYQGPPMEEGFMLAFPEEILRGAVPHRDFLHLYGPGSIYMLAGIFKVFGTHLYVERSVGLLQHAAVAYSMWFLLRPFGRRVATSGAAMCVVILIGPLGLSAMAWNGALAFGLAGLAVAAAAARRSGRTRRNLLFVAGALSGAALLFRPDLILAVGLGLGAWWFQLPKGRRSPIAWGLGITLALYIPHMIRSGMGNSIEGMFIEPVFKLRGGRSLPIPPSWGEVDGFLQRAGTLRTSGWPLPMPQLSQQISMWFWLVPLSIILVVVAAWRLRRREPHSRRSMTYWPAALFGAALLQQAIQRPDTAHLSWVTGVTFPLGVAAVVVLLEEIAPSLGSMKRFAIAGVTFTVLLLAVIPFYPVRTYVDLVGQSLGINGFGFPIRHDGRVFPFGSAEGAADAQQIVDDLDRLAEPGDSLITGPKDLSRTNYSDAFFYYLFPDLEVGTRYIEMDPGLADAPDSGLAEELENTDWVILSNAWADWSEPNDSSQSRSQAPNAVMREDFCQVDATATFELWGRCDRVEP